VARDVDFRIFCDRFQWLSGIFVDAGHALRLQWFFKKKFNPFRVVDYRGIVSSSEI
jgi:hypothetical protein